MKAAATALAFCAVSLNTWAGCLGPVIMGQCQGTTTPRDTHPAGTPPSPQPPPGTSWDHRSELSQPANGNLLQWTIRQQSINRFTRRDTRDPRGFLNAR